MIEILAPCGSPEVLTAALRTGCTAVYLGGAAFSARANAKNFTREELAEAVRLCHQRGVKVYQAINTVITDRELAECARTVKTACELGIDGLITQDLAVAEIVKECCPELELHASTQMTLHTAEGFMLARELGFSRAVASRELPQRILRELCALPIEVEVFVHGALCMAVSGQCYMSAVIGSRSANRGKCAQACRLPVSAADDRREAYALSLKDMCLIGRLRELREAGAVSFKIEGRMKRPEYVAAAVTAYRAALAGETPDVATLRSVFSRSGFTDGYLTGRRTLEMFGVRNSARLPSLDNVLPFATFAEEWVDADKLKAKLDSYHVPGVAWRTIHYQPISGRLSGKLIHGVQYYYTDYDAATLTLTQFYVMQAVWELYQKNPIAAGSERLSMFNKVCGTDFVSKTFGQTMKVSDIADFWSADVPAFKALSKKYYIY